MAKPGTELGLLIPNLVPFPPSRTYCHWRKIDSCTQQKLFTPITQVRYEIKGGEMPQIREIFPHLVHAY